MNDPRDDCKTMGHDFPWRVGGSGRRPTEGIDVCRRCGTVRTVDARGKKKFTRPSQNQGGKQP